MNFVANVASKLVDGLCNLHISNFIWFANKLTMQHSAMNKQIKMDE
jgi:hypothetical protein